MLTLIDKENILKEFPNIKLSYENITHKKVYKSDYIVAIPEGKKCFAWFITLNDKAVCLIMELENKNKIYDIKITNACFSNELAYGTIIYGTILYNSHNRFFYIEDIFSYKGNIIERDSWGEKLIKINNILKSDLKQISYNNSFIVFGLPLMCKTNEELDTKIASLNYKIESIQYILFNKVNYYLFMHYKNYIENKKKNINYENDNKNENEKIEKIVVKEPIKREIKQEQRKEFVFLIRPDIQDDIYYLYSLNNELKEEQQGILLIPNYNTSVMMNKLFRVIKENNNLDTLEESDDEEEFENENIDKFVHLEKSYKMICQFNHKFKKWVPIKLANEKDKAISTDELLYIYKIYEQNKKKQKF